MKLEYKEQGIYGAAAFAALFFFGGAEIVKEYNLTPLQFINKYLPVAKQIEAKYKIPYLLTLAQAGLESDWGNSGIAKASKNVFGIHDSAAWHGPIYTPPGDPNNASFRKYSSVNASFEDYGKFLTENSRYKPAFDSGTTDAVTFAGYIAAAGYSENPKYLDSVTNVIHTIEKALKAA